MTECSRMLMQALPGLWWITLACQASLRTSILSGGSLLGSPPSLWSDLCCVGHFPFLPQHLPIISQGSSPYSVSGPVNPVTASASQRIRNNRVEVRMVWENTQLGGDVGLAQPPPSRGGAQVPVRGRGTESPWLRLGSVTRDFSSGDQEMFWERGMPRQVPGYRDY